MLLNIIVGDIVRSYKGTVWNIIKTLIKQLITFLSFMKVKNKFMNIDVVYTNTSDNYMGLLLSIFLKKRIFFILGNSV